MMMKSIVTVIAAVMLAAVTPGVSPAQEYILGDGDLLKVTVYENEDLSVRARVSGDGTINVPLIGQMQLGGLTVGAAEKMFVERLKQGYLVDPHVSILVEEYRSRKVTILGEVAKPGLYELPGNASLLEIISKAGGLTDKAGSTVIIKRRVAKPEPQALPEEGQSQPPAQQAAQVQAPEQSAGQPDVTYISVNLSSLMDKGESAANMNVQDGDNIFVNKGGFIFVTGQVKKPGAFKFEEGTTVMKAIALAEGLTDRAAPGRTVLIRKQGQNEREIKVDMGFPVMPDDLISVPESFF
ncbi:MAG TPA: SLBB domain-containing protein [Nitrospirota bacterium]